MPAPPSNFFRTLRNQCGWAALTLVVTALASPCSAVETVTYPFQGVTLVHRTETSPRKLDIHVAIIDTLAPGIRFEVTPESPYADGTVVSQTTGNYISQIGAQLGINGDFYSSAGAINGLEHKNPSNFAASLGNRYSAFGGRPAFHAGKNNVAHIVTGSGFNPSTPVPVWNAVGGSDHLIQNGVLPTYWDDPTDPRYTFANELHPRTAVGINVDRTKVAFFVVDGRQSHSGGMNFPEMADMLLHDYDMHWAINLDGGGSTTMAIADPTPRVLNRPSDGTSRSVANSLALFARPMPPPVPTDAQMNAYRQQAGGYAHVGAQILSGDPTSSSVGGAALRVGYDTTVGKSRGVLSFDLSSIPTSATIHGVSLTLDAFSATGTATHRYVDLEVHELTDPIVEDQVSWNQSASGNNWTTAGGDFGGAPLSSLVAQKTAGLKKFVSTVDFVAAAQEALIAGNPLGLLVTALDAEAWGTANASDLNMRFRSDDATTGQRPTLTVHFTPAPGDFNVDGIVDAADYVAWRKGVPASATTNEYPTWRSNFGEPNAAGASFAVPEPSIWLLSATSMLLRRLRRRQRR
jgi:hypothetical protein